MRVSDESVSDESESGVRLDTVHRGHSYTKIDECKHSPPVAKKSFIPNAVAVEVTSSLRDVGGREYSHERVFFN